MAVGTLRYGRNITSDVGNTVEWCHWYYVLLLMGIEGHHFCQGCVTPNYLRD